MSHRDSKAVLKVSLHAFDMTSRWAFIGLLLWLNHRILDLSFNSFSAKESVFGFSLGNKINTLPEVLHSLTKLVSYENILTPRLALGLS